jgi:hypothetical protein
MPTRFIDNFSFRNGDVIYGDRDDRDSYKSILRSAYLNGGQDLSAAEASYVAAYQCFDDLFITIDQYNNVSYLAYESRENVIEGLLALARERRRNGKNSGDIPQLEEYVNSLPNELFDKEITDNNRDKLGRKEGLVGVSLNSAEDDKIKQNLITLYRIRKSCKFGVLNLAEAIKTNARIHFVLDSYLKGDHTQNNSRMQQVIDKSPFKSKDMWRGVGSTFIPVTVSELRCMYRNWDKLGRDRVIFYNNADEVDPPWVTYKDHWREYDKYRCNKYCDKVLSICEKNVDKIRIVWPNVTCAECLKNMGEFKEAVDTLKRGLKLLQSDADL